MTVVPVHEAIYPTTSWAVGIVVPDGATLEGNGSLSWAGVSNLTSLILLPHISAPSGIVYAVMSVMAADGSVLQVAAGAYPNSSSWLAYSWEVEGAQTTPAYDWILNSSAPSMSAGDRVSFSIFRNSTLWDLKVTDLDAHASVERAFTAGTALAFESGDQEAFALESYSRSASDFEKMGNLTLLGLFADGQRIFSGFYEYSGWDPTKNPIFAVGSSGTNPPIFISLQQIGRGSFVWGYVGIWPGGTFDYGTVLGVFVAVGLAGLIFAVCAAILVFRKKPAGEHA
jgi:hypothetical protein